MAKKQKNTSEFEELKSGDVITTDQGEEIKLNAEQATDLNSQIQEDSKAEKAKEAPKKDKEKPKVFGSPRFLKVNNLNKK